MAAERRLEAMTRPLVERIFEEKKRKLGVDAVLELKFIWETPIVDKNVYAEAFPFEIPPRVWMEVFAPDATTKEITEIVCDELVHVQHPELRHEDEEFKRRVRECAG